MQRDLSRQRRSDEEAVKQAGLVLDFDEIARKGSMSREEISIAKWYGIYHSRQPGAHMARVVIPGGQLTSVEARSLARIADKFSTHRISFTTRQSAQLHWLKLHELASFLREIKAAGLTTFHGCGDVTRNVVACPWASVCPHRIFDVLPYAKATAERLADCRELDNLPRKFKVSYSGCGGDCGQPYINCVGAIAVSRQGPNGGKQENGFRVVIGGGMGWKPFVAQPLFSFVPPEQIVEVCRAVGLVFRDQGDRYIRMFARLKFVVHRLGIDRCRTLVNEYLDRDGIDRSGIEEQPIEYSHAAVPDRPLCEPNPCGDDSRAIQRIKVPKGELLSEHLVKIAELSEVYGDKHVYSTNRQNLELHGVEPRRLPQLRAEVHAMGLEADDFYGLSDVVSCVGTTYCPLAVSSTHTMFDLLRDLVHEGKYAAIRNKVLVNITGCPNSCSPYRIADIGLRGLRIREQVGSTEGYQITVGGTQNRFGEVVGEFKQDDCIGVVAAILDAFMRLRKGAETLADNVARLGIEPYCEAVQALSIEYKKAVNPLELSAVTGRGETARDFKTIARDVPCRTACPARTNVPEYIRHLAHGRPEEAFLVNQDDNVLPGVLGRICTRPCEGRCRYQWTSIKGPVRICHLKRSAADGKGEPSKPLPPYYPPSGKHVAIVGGGPAGLAAARELKRYGHSVLLLEREPYLGGQVRVGIPTFRLPREVLEEDIAAIVNSGVKVLLNHAVDAAELDSLCKKHDAVLLAAGANRPKMLELDGLPPGVGYEGLRFMKGFNDDAPLAIKGDVVVVGGGFTAVDCARTARRLLGPGSLLKKGTGSEPSSENAAQNNGREVPVPLLQQAASPGVSIMYRRGEGQMSATAEELHEMRQEGVRIETLVTPVAAKMKDGKLESLVFCRNVLGPERDAGKPTIEPIPESEFVVPCQTLIFSIGQTQELDVLPKGVDFSGGRLTTRQGLFVAGDFSSGNADVISAIADGKQAADEIDVFLTGKQRRRQYLRVEPAQLTGRLRDHDLVDQPEMPLLPLGERGLHDEVELGLTPQSTETHAWRCYLCNYKFEIDQDKCIHCDWCIKVSPRNCILRLSHLELDADGAPLHWTEVRATDAAAATYIWIDADQCIRCGNCINICPVDAISLRKCDCTGENCDSIGVGKP